MHAHKVQAHETHVREVHAYVVHNHKVYPMRCTPMRSCPRLRRMPVVTHTSCLCGLGTWRTQACLLYLVALLHLPFFFRFDVLV
jgi:hypothetical protein